MVSNDRHIEDEEGAPLSKPTTDALAALHVNPLAQDDQVLQRTALGSMCCWLGAVQCLDVMDVCGPTASCGQ